MNERGQFAPWQENHPRERCFTDMQYMFFFPPTVANLINIELEGRDMWDPNKGREGETVGSSEGRKTGKFVAAGDYIVNI